jgi:serine/threonine-protein kinase
LLCFSSGARSIKLKISEVTDISLLPVLFQAILNYAPHVPRDPEIQSLLGLDTTNSTYTELWLKALTAPPERSRLAPLSEGTILQADEYKIVARIGAGGQAVAYSAIQRNRIDPEKLVVLKEYVLPVGVSHSNKVESLEKFQHEAKILGRINHPQIVKLLDFFFEDHRGYMVLEHINGQSLNAIVNESGALGEAVVIDLAAQMANILSYLHSQDPPIIHRDFTPDNLILNNDGVLKLIDFNVAQQKRSTVTATVVGKHAYIAPDQFRGHPSPQSDLYSLGATLTFLLTGQDPKPISQSRPKTKNETISKELDDIVATCTAVELSARFKSAEELAGRLKELKDQKAHSETISLSKPESVER